jgi:hypothetical protein
MNCRELNKVYNELKNALREVRRSPIWASAALVATRQRLQKPADLHRSVLGRN